MPRRQRRASFAAIAGLACTTTAAAQGTVRGVAYDSLLGGPLARAQVQLRGTTLSAVTDSFGRFLLEGVPPGRHILLLAHPGLDSAGLYTVAAPVDVPADRPAVAALGVPSLGTVWRRVCRTPLGPQADSGIVFGSVSDAATGSRFAGAAVVATWTELRTLGRTQVAMEPHAVTALSDSVGNYYACGVTRALTPRLRAYTTGDSTGPIEVPPGRRPVARRDFTIGRASVAQAALRGVVQGPGGAPLSQPQIVIEAVRTDFARGDGRFLLTGLPAGTQWVRALAVGYEPAGEAVDLRDGDTVDVILRLQAAPVTLDTVRVQATRASQQLLEFEERRKIGWGHTLTEAELQQRVTMRSVFVGIPNVFTGGRSPSQFTLQMPRPDGSRCVPLVFIDGRTASVAELYAYQPGDLAGVEVYVRSSTTPGVFQRPGNNCGVVAVWIKPIR
jgi:hypothetical protein